MGLRASYLTAVWSLIVAEGGAITPTVAATMAADAERLGEFLSSADLFSRFGSTLQTDLDATVAAADLIRTHGINYDASGEPATGSSVQFDGTDNSGISVQFLYGWLVTGDGTRTLWALQTHTTSFPELLRLLIERDDSVQVALARLDDRVGSLRSPDLFPYTCKL